VVIIGVSLGDISLAYLLAVLTTTSSVATTSATHTAAWSSSHTAHHLVLRLGRCPLNIDLLAGDLLLGRLQQVRHHLLRIEGDEAEALALRLLLVEWHLNLNDL